MLCFILFFDKIEKWRPPAKLSPNFYHIGCYAYHYDFMILDSNTNCNTYDKKSIKNYSIITYTCPKCGAKHSLTVHGYYTRNCCFFDDNFKICEKKLLILRVRCKGCFSTHAILPGNIIPYGIYDNLSILHFLTQHFVFNQSVLNISEKYGISYQLVYNYISKFKAFLYSLYFFLKAFIGFDSDISDIAGMLKLINKSKDFFYQYFFYTKWVFMMTRYHNILPRPVYVVIHSRPPTRLVNSNV